MQAKRYSRFVELAKRQSSGNAHGLGTGMGLVNLVHGSGQSGDVRPLDLRVYAPDQDGQPRKPPVHARFARVVAEDQLRARPGVCGSWYAAGENLKQRHRAEWPFSPRSKATGW